MGKTGEGEKMIGYPRSWTASDDPEDKTGTAQFKIDGKDYTLKLNSFYDFQTIASMLDIAFTQGRDFGCGAMREVVRNAADKKAREFGLD